MAFPLRIPRRSAEQQAQVDGQTARMALYCMAFCPYCLKVLFALFRLRLKIERRNIHDLRWKEQLTREGGRFQVPCLRIDDPAEGVCWLYESGAIVLYLKQRFSQEPI